MRISVPATTANMGAGFDTFGMALGYYNYVSAAEAETPSLQIIGEGSVELAARKDNLVSRSIRRVYEEVGVQMPPLKLVLENNIPLSRGMGSSAAAIIGGMYAANALLGAPLDAEKLLELAVSIEGHPDNVAPALYGGFVVSVTEADKKIHTVKMPPPPGLKTVICVPEYKLSTKKAREALPKNVPMRDAVFNIGHAAMLVGAFASGNSELLRIALQDRLHQPYRFPLIPGAEDVIEAAVSGGALACTLSGSGSSMIAYTMGNTAEIGERMCKAFAAQGINARYIDVSIDNFGARIMQEE